MLYIDEREYPLSVQIFGGDKETLVEAAKFVEENTQAAIIDINMGCPVNKILKLKLVRNGCWIRIKCMRWFTQSLRQFLCLSL